MSNNIQSKPENPFKNPKPFDIGSIIGTPDLKNISYTSFDFFSIKERVIEYVKKYFPNDFNDFVESDLGIMLIELWAYMADLISFKLDLYSNEVFIDTVSQRKNAHRIAQLVGYPTRPPRPAKMRISATLGGQYDFDVKIRSGFFVSVTSRDGRPLNIELFSADEEWNPLFDESIIIPAGSITNLSIIGLEGTSLTESYTSTGDKFQFFTVSNNNVLEGSISVLVNNQRWTEVDFFTDNDNGPYYKIEYDENHRASILFSDDSKGRIPPNGSTISISYRYGGGQRGNIDIGYINQIINITSETVPGPVPITITNYTKGQNGEEAETIEELKTKLPMWVKSQNRAVSAEDYSFLAESFSTLYHGRIGKAKAVLRNSGCSGNIIDIYILQQDSANNLMTANSTLKRELSTFFNSKKMLTDFICIKDASQVYQDINVNLSINKFYSELKKDINDKTLEIINDFFSLDKWFIGQPLKKQDLIQYLHKIPSIVSINVEFTYNSQNLVSDQNSLVVDFWKIIRPGNINISIDTVD